MLILISDLRIGCKLLSEENKGQRRGGKQHIQQYVGDGEMHVNGSFSLGVGILEFPYTKEHS